MPYVHSFTSTPPKRYQSGTANAWTDVRIEESANNSTWGTVEVQALSSLDTDPSTPAQRSLTTELASLAQGWFRFIWLDSDADESPPCSAVYSPGGGSAVDKVAALAAADNDPTLTDAEISSILDDFKIQDSSGNYPDETDWTATYDLNGAAAEAWRQKAGKASERFNFAEDGQKFDRAQVYAHCVRMAGMYAKRSATGMGSLHTVPIGGTRS